MVYLNVLLQITIILKWVPMGLCVIYPLSIMSKINDKHKNGIKIHAF